MAKACPPIASHLAASMRVVASHLQMRRVTIDTARDEVLKAAHRLQAGTAEAETKTFVARLEKVTGASIGELAMGAQRWHEA
jgi:acetyl-CoA carboxylase alpha subunit